MIHHADPPARRRRSHQSPTSLTSRDRRRRGERRRSSSSDKPYCPLPLAFCLLGSPPGLDPDQMASMGRSMTLSLLLFAVTLSLLQMYRGVFASSELMTIAGGFVSALLFLLLLTFIGNYQEATGIRTGWGAVAVAELVALIVAGSVHRVCVTTCFLFSAGFLYEVDKLSGMILARSDSKARRY